MELPDWEPVPRSESQYLVSEVEFIVTLLITKEIIWVKEVKYDEKNSLYPVCSDLFDYSKNM